MTTYTKILKYGKQKKNKHFYTFKSLSETHHKETFFLPQIYYRSILNALNAIVSTTKEWKINS
jgi:hypothetical protein